MKQKGFVLVPIIIIVVLIGAVGFFAYQNIHQQKINENPRSTPRISATNLPQSTINPSQIDNWKTYTDKNLGITFKYEKYYFITSKWPEKFDAFKEAPIVFTDKPNFNTDTLKWCDMNQVPLKDLCLLPGENFKQSDYITGTELANKPAILFYINTGNPTNNVLQVVQTTDNPKIEIAIPIDGMGGQEAANQILSTFKFTQ